MEIIKTHEVDRHKRLNENHNEWLYNGLDCCVTLEVFEEIQPLLDEVTFPIYTFGKALQAPLLEMSLRGMLVDQHKRKSVLDQCERETAKLTERLNELVTDGIGLQGDFSWSSTRDLNILFYEAMGLPVQRRRREGGRMTPSVDEDALEALQSYLPAEPICAYILALRDREKKRQFLTAGIDPDGRFRTTLSLRANTGRLTSSKSPFETGGNVQNIDRRLREIFVADPGMKFANLDLEQADARNLGAVCWNLFLQRFGPEFAGKYLDFCESGDLHTKVSQITYPNLPWGTAPDKEVAEAMADPRMSYRDRCKRLGHAANYLITERSAARKTKIPLGNVHVFFDRYFNEFQCIPAWHQHIAERLRTPGQQYITTLLGRRRYFYGRPPARNIKNLNESDTLREAVAYEPQSLTGDEINTGLLRVWRAGRVQLLSQVHDSILLQYPEEQEDEIIPWALKCLKVDIELEQGRQFHVPVEAKVGWNYGEFDVDNPLGLKKWSGSDDRKRG